VENGDYQNSGFSQYGPYYGLTIAIGNAQGGPGKLSPVGNIKLARVSLLVNAALPVKYQAIQKKAINNRYIFTPAPVMFQYRLFPEG